MCKHGRQKKFRCMFGCWDGSRVSLRDDTQCTVSHHPNTLEPKYSQQQDQQEQSKILQSNCLSSFDTSYVVETLSNTIVRELGSTSSSSSSSSLTTATKGVIDIGKNTRNSQAGYKRRKSHGAFPVATAVPKAETIG